MGSICCAAETSCPSVSRPDIQAIPSFAFDCTTLIWVLGSRLRKDILREVTSYWPACNPLLLLQPAAFTWVVPPVCGSVARQPLIDKQLLCASFTLASLGVGQGVLCVYDYGQPGNRVQLLNNGHSTPMPRTLVQRDQPGMIFDPSLRSLYLFGGINYDNGYPFAMVRKSERFDFSSYQWTPVEDMTYARASFTPCRYAGLIYLCGGHQSTVETYAPCTRLYQTLQITLPEASSCLVLFQRDVLVVLSDNYLTRWQGLKQVTKRRARHPVTYCQQPLLTGNCLYAQNLLTFDLWELEIEGTAMRRLNITNLC